MRLLQRSDDGRLSLTEQYFGDEIPDYAILSHCWGPDDTEPRLQDIENNTGENKAGYEKIRLCGIQAKKDRLQYFWADTCCIDKTNNAELSEALNSMYQWYRGAAICYAYLYDVSESDSDATFSRSKWFTRAWTLQELLAPQEIAFYSREWSYLGSRSSLNAQIAEITGIDQMFLQGKDLSKASIAKRMSWAAYRKAKRPEDISYSLFGIFNVHMPPLYGEGLESAFKRLQEEIMKYSSDQTLLAWDSLRGGRGSSGLAKKPFDFVLARDLVPCETRDQDHPFSMTNLGLRISVPLKYPSQQPPRQNKWSSTVVWASLRCRKERDFENRVEIPLRHLKGNQFVRHPTERLSYSTIEDHEPAMSEIFICSPPSSRIEHDDRVTVVLSRLPSKLRLAEVYPSTFWYPDDHVFQGQLLLNQDSESWDACAMVKFSGKKKVELFLVYFTMLLPLPLRQMFDTNPLPTRCTASPMPPKKSLKEIYGNIDRPWRNRFRAINDMVNLDKGINLPVKMQYGAEIVAEVCWDPLVESLRK